MRGLYNFGPDPREGARSPELEKVEQEIRKLEGKEPTTGMKGRFSAGAEMYYGLLNKSGGISTGIRFATLPSHSGFPYTMTLTLNPLMGNLSSTYAVKAGRSLALCSRFDFNFYSYESELQVGMELWRRRRWNEMQDLSWVQKKLQDRGWSDSVVLPSLNLKKREPSNEYSDENTAGVLKARINQDWGVGLVWEGRVKELLYTCGVLIDFKKREQIFRSVGLEIQYSS